jgi:RNA polymerase-binding transcription factor DksA
MAKNNQKSSKIAKSVIQDIKQKLESQKEQIEQDLKKIAVPNEKIPGDWQSKFPYGNSDSGTASLERQADEVEEYTTRLPMERKLETRLAAVNLALKKIDKGTYGLCSNCGKEILQERLEIFPEADLCVDCQKK